MTCSRSGEGGEWVAAGSLLVVVPSGNGCGGNASTRAEREGAETSLAQKGFHPIFPKYTIMLDVFRTPSIFKG